MNLLGLTYPRLMEHVHQRYGKGHFHAAALYRAFYQGPDLDLERNEAFAANGKLGKQIQGDLTHCLPHVVDKISQDGVVKLVLELADGLRIETVIIPMTNHATVCISCQVGCRMGCRFCRTGKMGWLRNLSVEEIVAQVYLAKVILGFSVRNVVFMGMGEPLDNFDCVTHAIEVMADQRGLDIAKRHITLSTVGLPQGIERLSTLNWPQLKLAVSLNAADDALRSRLMPINRQYPMARLKQALRRYPLARGNALFFEYVLIKGINDDPRNAAKLAEFFEDLPVKLNLIAFNSGACAQFETPTASDIRRFQDALIDQRIFVRLRSSKGAGIRAACGQLGAAFHECRPGDSVPPSGKGTNTNAVD